MNWDVWHMSTGYDVEEHKKHLREEIENLKIYMKDIAEEIARVESKLADLEAETAQLSLPGVK